VNPWSWSEHTLRVLTALGTTGAVIALVLVESTRDSGARGESEAADQSSR
jgi:hypothetical protein